MRSWKPDTKTQSLRHMSGLNSVIYSLKWVCSSFTWARNYTRHGCCGQDALPSGYSAQAERRVTCSLTVKMQTELWRYSQRTGSLHDRKSQQPRLQETAASDAPLRTHPLALPLRSLWVIWHQTLQSGDSLPPFPCTTCFMLFLSFLICALEGTSHLPFVPYACDSYKL